jgi:hypothetical protein
MHSTPESTATGRRKPGSGPSEAGSHSTPARSRRERARAARAARRAYRRAYDRLASRASLGLARTTALFSRGYKTPIWTPSLAVDM